MNSMASIAIIGSGFVGQANGKVLAKQGHRVLFIDIDPTKVAQLKEEGYHATLFDQFPPGQHIDIFFIAVPTPTIDGEVKLSAVEKAAQYLGGLLSDINTHPLVVLKSTVPPGTTEKLLIPMLEKHSGKKESHDFEVAFEPEYLREKTSLEDAECPKVITIGTKNDTTASVLEWLRSPFHCPIRKLSIQEAEFQKYVHNLFNAAKITFFNEMRRIAKRMEVDAEEVFDITVQTAEASWNPRYGIRDFGPFDGSCLPKDTAGFLGYAKTALGMDMPLLSTIISVNRQLEKEEETRKKQEASQA